DLDDVAGPPGRHRFARCGCEQDLEYRAARAARIEPAPRGERPAAEPRGLPVREPGGARGHPDVVLPVAERGRVAVVDFDQVEQRLRPGAAQPAVELVAKRTVVVVAAVAQGKA